VAGFPAITDIVAALVSFPFGAGVDPFLDTDEFFDIDVLLLTGWCRRGRRCRRLVWSLLVGF
jgi:hypothetical protein